MRLEEQKEIYDTIVGLGAKLHPLQFYITMCDDDKRTFINLIRSDADLSPSRFRKKAKKLKNNFSWVAPEHQKMVNDAKRDRNGNLILDFRPTILRPERQVYYNVPLNHT